MSASAFDPWAMLAKLRGQDQAPADPISGISGISGEVAPPSEIALDAANDPISGISRFSREGASHSEIAREPANDVAPSLPPDPSPPWCRPGPIVPLYRLGVVPTPDLWLNRLAGIVARAMAEGATVRPCPLGGLDLERPCGRRVWVSGEHVREMRAAGLLPDGVPGR